MASTQTRSRTGPRILLGVIRVAAAAVVAVTASAALADLDLRPVEFSRILPVVLTGEGIIYILMLGGGAVAAPVLFTGVICAFAMRVALSLGAAMLSPQAGGDLIAGAKFYYAAYWPAAAAQVLMVALMLRLVRPLIARRRRRLGQSARPQVDEAIEDERREVLLEAIAEAPDSPPESPTVLEERQIGDLADPPARKADGREDEQALALPFEGEEDAESAHEEHEPEEAEEAEEESLPPGVIDATPEALAAREAEAEAVEVEPEPEEREEESLPPGVIDATAEARGSRQEEAEAVERKRAQQALVQAMEGPGEGGEDTARMDPVSPMPAVESLEDGPPEDLQGMINAIARATGEGTDVRVWTASGGRTVLAAVPAGTPAAGTAAHADALVNAHLETCAWLGGDGSCRQLSATGIGAWAVQALDADGTVLLVMASRGEAAAGRLEVAIARTADAVRGLAKTTGSAAAPTEADAGIVLSPEDRIGRMVTEAAKTVGGHFGAGWRTWRGPHRRAIAVNVPPGIDIERAGRKVARMAAPVERFADAIALDAPQWLALSANGTTLVLRWADVRGEALVLAAQSPGGVPVGRVRWELDEIARQMAQQGSGS